MSTATTPRAAALTTPRIVFIVVAAAAPIAAMIGLAPLQYALGNGAGTPSAYLIAGAILLCFAVGYAAMSRQITNTGGFYTFITRGLGRPVGVPGSFIALIAYIAVGLELAGGFGYFTSLTLQQLLHVSTPWYLWTVIGALAAGLLSYHSVDLNAKVLGLLMVLEIGVLMVLNVAIVGHKGLSAFPATSFAPHTAFSSGFSVALLIAFNTFIGFESAALYGEESRQPKRTVPRAVYASLLTITVFYGLTSWLGVGATGAAKVQTVAGQQLGNYFLMLSDKYVASAFSTTVSVLVCTSIFASMLAIQNAASRYIFSLGRERVLPSWTGRAHPRHGSPARATLIVTGANLLVPGLFALTHQNPYLTLVASMTGLGAIGIITLQGLAAASVIGYFWRHPDRHWWKTLLAPAVGLAGLVVAATLVVAHFSLLTGTKSTIINALPWLIPAVSVVGLLYAAWLRHNRPAVYLALASDSYVNRDDGHDQVDPPAHHPQVSTQSLS